MQKLGTCSNASLHSWICVLLPVCSPSLGQLSSIDNMHVILSMYAKYVAYHLLAVQEREGQYTCKEMTIAKLKIVPKL